jgi:hypothetical protein
MKPNRIFSFIALALVAGSLLPMSPHSSGDAFAVPHCPSDDFNDGSLPVCYTVTVKGEVIYINAQDEVLPSI